MWNFFKKWTHLANNQCKVIHIYIHEEIWYGVGYVMEIISQMNVLGYMLEHQHHGVDIAIDGETMRQINVDTLG